MGRDCVLYPSICYLVNTCGIWVKFGNLSITEKLVFRSYKNNIIHNVSFSINGLVMENALVQRSKIWEGWRSQTPHSKRPTERNGERESDPPRGRASLESCGYFCLVGTGWCEFMVIEEVLTGRQVARFTLTDLQADIPMWSCLLIRRNAKVSVEGWQEDKQVRPRGMELKQNKGQKPFLAIHLIPTPKGKRALLVCLGKN